MPELSIQGVKLNRIHDARVEITHGNAREAAQIPIMQFKIRLPLDDDDMLGQWALAPHGPKRWKTVELQTLDRSHGINHTWTMHKAYVHEYVEVEFAAGSGNETDQGNYVELTLRGTLMHTNIDYDGKNVLAVKAGEKEPESA
jgi:hypothetical protein